MSEEFTGTKYTAVLKGMEIEQFVYRGTLPPDDEAELLRYVRKAYNEPDASLKKTQVNIEEVENFWDDLANSVTTIKPAAPE